MRVVGFYLSALDLTDERLYNAEKLEATQRLQAQEPANLLLFCFNRFVCWPNRGIDYQYINSPFSLPLNFIIIIVFKSGNTLLNQPDPEECLLARCPRSLAEVCMIIFMSEYSLV